MGRLPRTDDHHLCRDRTSRGVFPSRRLVAGHRRPVGIATGFRAQCLEAWRDFDHRGHCGYNLGYQIGRATGPRIFTREDSLLFNKKHLLRAQAFYEKHGGKTVVFARFMPIVRTFAPVVAGVARMRYRSYLFYSVLGGIAWIWSMLMIGFVLGRTVPGVAQHIEKVILVVIFLSISPGIISWWRERSASTDGATRP